MSVFIPKVSQEEPDCYSEMIKNGYDHFKSSLSDKED